MEICFGKGRKQCENGENVQHGDATVALLTLYHTIMTFNNPVSEVFENIVGKGEKCW